MQKMAFGDEKACSDSQNPAQSAESLPHLGERIDGLGLGLGSGVRGQGFGLQISNFGFRIWGFEFQIKGSRKNGQGKGLHPWPVIVAWISARVMSPGTSTTRACSCQHLGTSAGSCQQAQYQGPLSNKGETPGKVLEACAWKTAPVKARTWP